MKKTLGIVMALTLFAGNGLSYGPRGHGLVGAIADRRLAKDTSVKAKVDQLLDGLTLQRVATLPDEIKTWDSSAQIRWFVVPERPAGTDGMSEGELAKLVTPEGMMGVAKV